MNTHTPLSSHQFAFSKLIPIITLCCFALLTTHTDAKYRMPELEEVPVNRLITNLENQLTNNPNNSQTHYALARVHSIAYATRTETLSLNKETDQPFFGFGQQSSLPPEKSNTPDNPEDIAETENHLKKAIIHYKKAVAIDPEHLPSQLGLAWSLQQSNNENAAREAYRIALELAWDNEQNLVFELSMTEEIAQYLLPLLDPEKDAVEIDKVRRYLEVVAKAPRAMTPILIPLYDHINLDDLVNPHAAVKFDLDGSGHNAEWGWITPSAGWLVYDPTGEGNITSGLQMFGAVTFWISWQNGYHALAALDDNGDGILNGNELNGLAIWHDTNGNGISEAGEVRTLNKWNISSLSCQFETHSSGIPFSPQGVHFKNGNVRPSYDWISHSR